MNENYYCIKHENYFDFNERCPQCYDELHSACIDHIVSIKTAWDKTKKLVEEWRQNDDTEINAINLILQIEELIIKEKLNGK